PSPDEIDAKIAAQPWILRNRLTLEAFTARCHRNGIAPTPGMWLEHIALTDEELELSNDLMETLRECHEDEVPWDFVIRHYGGQPRVGRFDKRGHLETMSLPNFRMAYANRYKEVMSEEGLKKVRMGDFWLGSPRTRYYERVEFRPGVAQRDM